MRNIVFILFFIFINLKANPLIELNLLSEEPIQKEQESVEKNLKFSTVSEIIENKEEKWNEVYDMKIISEGQIKPSFLHFSSVKELVSYERKNVKNDSKISYYKIHTEKKTLGYKDVRSKEFNKEIIISTEDLNSRFQLCLQYDFNKNPFYMEFDSAQEIFNYIENKNVKNDYRLKLMKIFIKKEKTGFKDVRVIEYSRLERLNETEKNK